VERKSTVGERGDWSARTNPHIKKNHEKNLEEKPVWVRGPSPPMADHVLDLGFKPRPLIIGMHVGVEPEFELGCLAVHDFLFLFCK